MDCPVCKTDIGRYPHCPTHGDLARQSTTCPICGESQDIVATVVDLERWDNGALIQDALSYLSADQREALISGICAECWAKMDEGDEGD